MSPEYATRCYKLTGDIARLEQLMRFARNHDERQDAQRELARCRIELYHLQQHTGE